VSSWVFRALIGTVAPADCGVFLWRWLTTLGVFALLFATAVGSAPRRQRGAGDGGRFAALPPPHRHPAETLASLLLALEL